MAVVTSGCFDVGVCGTEGRLAFVDSDDLILLRIVSELYGIDSLFCTNFSWNLVCLSVWNSLYFDSLLLYATDTDLWLPPNGTALSKSWIKIG